MRKAYRVFDRERVRTSGPQAIGHKSTPRFDEQDASVWLVLYYSLKAEEDHLSVSVICSLSWNETMARVLEEADVLNEAASERLKEMQVW